MPHPRAPSSRVGPPAAEAMGGTSLFLSDRLILRDVAWGDLEARRQWWSDPDVIRHLGFVRGHPERGPKGRASLEWTVALRESGEPIGVAQLAGIDEKAGRASLGLVIGRKDLWHQGYGAEAVELILALGFDVMGLERVELTVEARHTTGIGLYERVGFQIEGRLPEPRLTDEGPQELLVMSITRSAWDSRSPERSEGSVRNHARPGGSGAVPGRPVDGAE